MEHHFGVILSRDSGPITGLEYVGKHHIFGAPLLCKGVPETCPYEGQEEEEKANSSDLKVRKEEFGSKGEGERRKKIKRVTYSIIFFTAPA